MVTIDDILEHSNLMRAMEHLISKRNSCGIDNVYVSEFAEYWATNQNVILDSLWQGEYEPDLVVEREIVGYNGKHRIISQMTCTDRFILRALNQVLQPLCEQRYLECSHAYREAHGVESAVRMAADYISEGCGWVAEIDIDHFFDTIPINRMEETLFFFIDMDDPLKNLVRKYLRCRVECQGKIITKQKGLVQGSPISPMLSNLYLTPLDYQMMSANYAVVRFSDDIRILAECDETAATALETVKHWLSVLELGVNEQKSGVFQAINRKFLGFRFEKQKDGKIVAQKSRSDKVNYVRWHTSALQKVDKNYHLINDGILTKHDYSLLFENENGKHYLPVETVDSINLYSEVIMTTHLFDFISQKRLRMVLFDKYGKYLGSFSSERYGAAGKTLLKQAEIYLDANKRLELAKKIDMATMHNLRANLRYYKKQKKSERLEKAIQFLSDVIVQMNEAQEIDKLMLIEARGRQEYYHTFNEIITNPDFSFEQRTKRPPKDPLNAMISFGNVYLYNRLATEIHKTSLDIRIGFLHSTNSRAESLNLDLAELFKPILIDRAIFTLINKHMIHMKEHFEISGNGGVYLNRLGKRLFLEEMENKIYQKVQFNGNERTYEYIMREEIQKVLRYVLYEKAYKPYKYTT